MYSAASPVLVAVLEALYAVSAVVTAAAGGIHDDVPPSPSYPFVWIEVFHERDARGLGTGGMPEIELRTHVFSQFEGQAEAQELNRLIVGALKDASLTVAGYEQCGQVFYDDTVALRDEELAGQKVKETVSMFRIFARES